MALPAIGDLDQRIDLCGRGEAANGDGGTDDTYPVIATVWAKVAGPPRPLQGSLYQDGEQVEADLTHTVIIRGRPDTATVKFLGFRGRRLKVEKFRDLDVVPRFQLLLCTEQ